MVRFFYQGLVAMALVGGSAAEKDPCVVEGDTFGGEGGNPFSDIDRVNSNKTIKEIRGRSGERVDAIGLCYSTETCVLYGGDGPLQTLPLGSRDRIIKLEVHQIEDRKHMKVAYMCFTYKTDSDDDNLQFKIGTPLLEGANFNDVHVFEAPANSHLIGLHGRSGNEIDKVGPLWLTENCEKTATPAPAVAPATDVLTPALTTPPVIAPVTGMAPRPTGRNYNFVGANGVNLGSNYGNGNVYGGGGNPFDGAYGYGNGRGGYNGEGYYNEGRVRNFAGDSGGEGRYGNNGEGYYNAGRVRKIAGDIGGDGGYGYNGRRPYPQEDGYYGNDQYLYRNEPRRPFIYDNNGNGVDSSNKDDEGNGNGVDSRNNEGEGNGNGVESSNKEGEGNGNGLESSNKEGEGNGIEREDISSDGEGNGLPALQP